MASHAPRWEQVREFCLKQGYRERRGDHLRYVKVLPDHSSSGTMISKGVEGRQVPPQMWRMVWRQQLRLASEDEFWKGLRGEPVKYAVGEPGEATVLLPSYLVNFLKNTLRYSDEKIAAVSREEAQELLNEFHARDLRCKE